MAFELVQKFKFDRAEYAYDCNRDVLDISFGPPAPAVAIQVEDWLAIRMQVEPPNFQGMTIVGFRKIFEKINRYAERELPKRMKRLAGVSLEMSLTYDDQNDTLIVRWDEKLTGWRGLVPGFFRPKKQKPSVFESLSKEPFDSLRTIYVEKALPSKKIIGLKILEFTKCGPAAIEAFLGSIIDTIFEPNSKHDENAHLITNALIQRLYWTRLAGLLASR
jgi:hypothetical protein